MAARIRLVSIVALSSLLPYFVASLLPASPQNPPADATEISRDLLFLAPNLIGVRPPSESPSGIEFRARHFAYFYAGLAAGHPGPDPHSEWIVRPNNNIVDDLLLRGDRKIPFKLGGEDYEVSGSSDDDRATLHLFRTGTSEPVITVELWTREQLATAWLPVLKQQNKALTRAALQKELEVGDPRLFEADSVGDSVWIALGHSIGEGELGLGTLAHFDVKRKEATIFQPPDLATCAFTQIGRSGPDELLLGTRQEEEKTVGPCAGLVRFHPSTRQVERISPPGSLLVNSLVTLLYSNWVATDRGICYLTAAGAPKCWRIVPTVTLKAPVTAFNKPGEKSGSELKPGDYEVLWANQAFLEIATKDSYDAWLAADDFAEAAARNFDTEPYKLLNTSSGISPIRPLVKPGGEALEGTLVYRAPLEKLPAPQGAPAGWVKVRIHAGWIARDDLEVLPKLIPFEK